MHPPESLGLLKTVVGSKKFSIFLALCFVLLSAFLLGAAQEHSAAGSSTAASSSSYIELVPKPDGNVPQEQMQRLFRAAADKDIENEKRLRDYTYVERDEAHKLDGKGQVKSTESKTFDVLEVYGEQVQRLTKKNDKDLDPAEAGKEEEKLQKLIDKRRNESDDARRKREEKERKEQEDGRKFVIEVADAYIFHLAGSESIGGRDAWVIDAEPRPGYEPHMKEAKFLPNFHGRVWIDKAEGQWAKLDIECIDTVSLGLFLARFHKGLRIVIEQIRVNDEVWLPRHVTVKVDVRLALFKDLNVEEDQTFRDYKKFRTTTRIVNVEDLPEK